MVWQPWNLGYGFYYITNNNGSRRLVLTHSSFYMKTFIVTINCSDNWFCNNVQYYPLFSSDFAHCTSYHFCLNFIESCFQINVPGIELLLSFRLENYLASVLQWQLLVTFTFIKPNCTSSILTCCPILCSKIFSNTFIAGSSSSSLINRGMTSTVHWVTLRFVHWYNRSWLSLFWNTTFLHMTVT